jgi:excisionase family DNA binding protein
MMRVADPDRDKQMQALKNVYDGLRMVLDGAYSLACLRIAEANDQAVETSIVKEIAPAQMLSDKKELTALELAEHWDVSDRSIYQWKTTHGLPFKKVGRLLRFDLAEAEAWAKRHRESFTKARLRVVR